MRGHAVVATMLVASVYAQALPKHGTVDWAVNATIIDGCSCQLLCPCIFGSPATVGSAATTSMRDAGPVTSTRRFS